MSGGGVGVGGDARTDMGWITASTIAQAAMVAVAVMNTVAAMEMNQKQMDIANGYLNLAQQLQSYWFSVFVPCETALVHETCALPEYVPQYDLTAGRYVAAVRLQFQSSQDNLRCISRYCVGLASSQAKDLAIAEAVAAANAMNFGYRYEDARKLQMDDVRFSRRLQALGLGRNLIPEAITAAKAGADIIGKLGAQANAGASQLPSALGAFLGGIRGQSGQSGQSMFSAAAAAPQVTGGETYRMSSSASSETYRTAATPVPYVSIPAFGTSNSTGTFVGYQGWNKADGINEINSNSVNAGQSG